MHAKDASSKDLQGTKQRTSCSKMPSARWHSFNACINALARLGAIHHSLLPTYLKIECSVRGFSRPYPLIPFLSANLTAAPGTWNQGVLPAT